MSSPHAPNGPNQVPLPPMQAAPTSGHNPWGEGHVGGFKPGSKPTVTYTPTLGSERGILGRVDIDQHRENEDQRAAKDPYRQPGHEVFTTPVLFGRMALTGETHTGKELGMAGRTAAAIGAIVLSPAALGYPITLAIRAAANKNRGRTTLFKRVVPLAGEGPHRYK